MRDLTGLRQGRLTVLSCSGDGRWKVRCDCGRERVVRGSDLRSGLIRDCGMRCPLREKEEAVHECAGRRGIFLK